MSDLFWLTTVQLKRIEPHLCLTVFPGLTGPPPIEWSTFIVRKRRIRYGVSTPE